MKDLKWLLMEGKYDFLDIDLTDALQKGARITKIVRTRRRASQTKKNRYPFGHLIVLSNLHGMPFSKRTVNEYNCPYVCSWVTHTSLGIDSFPLREEYVHWVTRLKDGTPVPKATISTIYRVQPQDYSKAQAQKVKDHKVGAALQGETDTAGFLAWKPQMLHKQMTIPIGAGETTMEPAIALVEERNEDGQVIDSTCFRLSTTEYHTQDGWPIW